MSVNDTAAALPAANGGALPSGASPSFTLLPSDLPLRFSAAALLWFAASGVTALWPDAADSVDAVAWERTGEFASLLVVAAGLLALVASLTAVIRPAPRSRRRPRSGSSIRWWRSG